MSYKIGDRVLHDSGWSAVIKSGTNKNGFTIEFDKRIVPENAERRCTWPTKFSYNEWRHAKKFCKIV